MKIALVQINSVVGAFEENFRKMRAFAERAKDADLVVFPECSICGYPPQDLLSYPEFAEQSKRYAEAFAKTTSSQTFVFGSVLPRQGAGKPNQNAAILATSGMIRDIYTKRLLPTYDVFDEDRFFEAGDRPVIWEQNSQKFGLSICEDIWSSEISDGVNNRYRIDPLKELSDRADWLLNLSASPFESDKLTAKRRMLSRLSAQHQRPLIYVNSVGGQDSLIFDGRSCVIGPQGVLLEMKAFEEDLAVFEADDLLLSKPIQWNEREKVKDLYDALVLGIQDYAKKQKFDSAVIGLSGGIDSAVVACLAMDALGPENVRLVMMPSRFTAKQSINDALHLGRITQCPFDLLSIEAVFEASLHTLQRAFEGLEPNTTEENLQARARGMLLMALSNKFNHLVLATGNKSELAVGYCTLYGDMCGGLAPLGDVYKTQVYELASEANRRWDRIPKSTIERAPTAELRPNQTDQEMLPPYDLLDRILFELIEGAKSPSQVIGLGFPAKEVEQIATWLERSEYKRYQMPLGLKVSKKAFGIGRRVPIVNRFFDLSENRNF